MSSVLAQRIEAVLRADGARLLASLIRLAGNFEHAEDALQEACMRALEHWPRNGLPDNPGAWLNTVARRIVFDRQRGAPALGLDDNQASAGVDPAELDASGIEDDRLRLLFTCCHPALSMEARCALALRTLGGLSTREIARAFVESETTTAQCIVRAKHKIAAAGIAYEVPARALLPQRLEAVLAVLYLIFNEGHTATEATTLQRPDLCRETIRLATLPSRGPIPPMFCRIRPGATGCPGLLCTLPTTQAGDARPQSPDAPQGVYARRPTGLAASPRGRQRDRPFRANLLETDNGAVKFPTTPTSRRALKL